MNSESLAEFLLTLPDAIARGLAQHRDDGHGECLSCGNARRAYSVWPCPIYTACVRASAERSDLLALLLFPRSFPT